MEISACPGAMTTGESSRLLFSSAMKKPSGRIVAFALAFLLLACAPKVFADAWQEGFDFSPFDGPVVATVRDSDGNVYFAGDFNDVNGIANTAHLVRWNATAQEFESVLVHPPEINIQLFTLAVDGNDDLYVGGDFGDFGDLENANAIARLDVSTGQWQKLGAGLYGGDVYTIVVDSNGDVYAGGRNNLYVQPAATNTNLAKWTATAGTWSIIGAGNSDLNALVLDGTRLYAGGRFTNVGGNTSADRVAYYDTSGGTWNALGQGVNNEVFGLQLVDGGDLVVGGRFITAYAADGNTVANTQGIARWDLSGNVWIPLGTGIPDGQVDSIAYDGSSELLVGGSFTSAGGASNTNGLARFESGAWSSVDGGIIAGEVEDLLYLSSDLFIVAGGFEPAGGGYGATVAVDAGSYAAPPWGDSSGNGAFGGNGAGSYSGNTTKIRDALFDADGNLYVGGEFESMGGVPGTRNIARWNGSAWESLDGGVNDEVWALAMDDSGKLYAGGTFSYNGDADSGAGGVAGTNYIAMWDGANWQSLDNGLDDEVYALLVDDSGDLYVGGYFVENRDQDLELENIARWDGDDWTAVGNGFDDSVFALAMNGDTLYAGGEFATDSTGGVTLRSLAAFNGATWEEVGGGVECCVNDLASRGGKLYVGGAFNEVDNDSPEAIANLAVWDGADWQALGTEIDEEVSRIHFDTEGNLFAGGWFTTNFNRVARWDGSAWSGLGSGADGHTITAIASDGRGRLFVGGDFATAGGNPSSRIAQWNYELSCSFFFIQSTNGKAASVCL